MSNLVRKMLMSANIPQPALYLVGIGPEIVSFQPDEWKQAVAFFNHVKACTLVEVSTTGKRRTILKNQAAIARYEASQDQDQDAEWLACIGGDLYDLPGEGTVLTRGIKPT